MTERFKPPHEMTLVPDVGFLRRFLDRVEVDDETECWVWTGGCVGKGYPALELNGKKVYAHRASCALFNGPIPWGMQVHHRCLNPKCVNPAHLEHTTPKRNRELQRLGVGHEDDAPPDTDDSPIPF